MTYVSAIDSIGNPLDELGILVGGMCTGKNVGIMLSGMEFWTTRQDNEWETCDVFFAYIGENVFVPIEHIDMSCTRGTDFRWFA